jgi:hypothetical protein
MHDHWVSLTAAAFGRIAFLPEPTLLYRQHGQNIFGARHYGLTYIQSYLTSGLKTARDRINLEIQQAASFLDRFRDRLESSQIQTLAMFSRINSFPPLTRRRILWRYKIFKTGLIRNVGLFCIL